MEGWRMDNLTALDGDEMRKVTPKGGGFSTFMMY
jgi:hypothetical protein